jgi:hypothetical protein
LRARPFCSVVAGIPPHFDNTAIVGVWSAILNLGYPSPGYAQEPIGKWSADLMRIHPVLAIIALAASCTPALAASTTANVSATIERPIAVAANSNLSLGAIVKPTAGSGTVTLSPANGRTVTGTNAVWLASPASSVANFTVTGEGGQAFTLQVDATDTMTNSGAGGGTLVVTTSNDAGCTSACALSGSLGGAGTLSFHIGGSFPFSNATKTGTYSGTINVSATYN